VVRDPNSPGSDADIQQSVQTLLQITGLISQVSDSINQIEWLRKQLEVLAAMLRPEQKKEAAAAQAAPAGDDDDDDDAQQATASPNTDKAKAAQKAELLKEVEAMNKKLTGIEYQLTSKALTNSDDKYFVEPYELYLNLMWLNAAVGSGGGDVAGGADFAPTDNDLALLKQYEGQYAKVKEQYQKLVKDDLPTLNRALESSNLAPVAGAGL
jgi:hypothetical protein